MTELSFSLDGVKFQVLNISHGKMLEPMQAHSHGAGCYEVHYIMEGKGLLVIQGQTYQGQNNTLYVTGPGIEHAQFSDAREPMEECCVYFYCKGSRTSPLVKKFLLVPFWFGQDCQEVKALMEKILDEGENRPTGYKERLQLLLAELIIMLIRNYEQGTDLMEHKDGDGSVDRTTLTIDQFFLYDYAEMTLERLAARLNISTRQTQRLLHKYYGKNFQEKKAEARMSMAVVMLQQTDKHIYEIAEELGYSSPEHFSNAFRKYYGVSPSEYRK
ncbi:MAG: AraC family transcriptional regulator [Firmicutes bacterium]|nr:AraC family transcriptional regulator [Bacillota bacterium]